MAVDALDPIRIGPYATNVVYQEDCIEGMKNIPDASVDLTIADPSHQDYEATISCAEPGISSTLTRRMLQTIKDMSRILTCGGSLALLKR